LLSPSAMPGSEEKTLSYPTQIHGHTDPKPNRRLRKKKGEKMLGDWGGSRSVGRKVSDGTAIGGKGGGERAEGPLRETKNNILTRVYKTGVKVGKKKLAWS